MEEKKGGSDRGGGHSGGRNHRGKNRCGGGFGGRGSDGGRSSVGNTFLWKSKPKQTAKSKSITSGKYRNQSYIDKLRSGEKTLDNVRDAQQFFKMLSKDYNDNTRLALKFDEEMENVLERATNLLHPDMNEPLKLLAAMGGEALIHGVYKERTLRCFTILYNATDFILKLTEQMTTGRLRGAKDHSVIAWFLLQLGKSGNEDVLNNPLVWDQIDFFKTSDQVGFPQLSHQLGVVFLAIGPEVNLQGSVSTDGKPGAIDSLSLEAAQRMMRPPGVRDHDNDKENFRAISIIPTTRELQCQESAYLPLADGSDYIENAEGGALDRQFRLMREDLLGSVKQELQTEFKISSNQRRRVLSDPCIIDFGMKPEPHVVVRVSIPPRLHRRIKSMKNPEASEFFDKGSGKRVLQKGTLVLLVHDASVRTSQHKTKNPGIRISAVGTIVERMSPLKIVNIPGTNPVKKTRVLEVGVSFTPESMRALTPLIQRLEHRNVGVPMICGNGGLFNASAGIFSLEPILKALVKLDQVPMCDQTIHLRQPTLPLVAHGGKSFLDLTSGLQNAVRSDQSQQRALEEIFKSNVVLVQGPPGTGKTYIGVQMVKSMLELEKKSPSGGPPLRILCLCYTNHALDSFLLDLIKAGVPKELFIRLGSSPKIDPNIKPRCLGEVGSSANTKFGPQENYAFGAIKRESEILEVRFKDLLKSIAESSTWGKSVSWWQKIGEWLEEHYYEEHDQLEVPDTTDAEGFQRTGKDGKALKSNYLWERWHSGLGRGIFQDEKGTPTGIWKLGTPERKCMVESWNQEWIQPQLDLLESTMESLQKNIEALRTLRQGNDLRVLETATIIGCTTVAAARYQGLINPTVVIVEEAGEILESHVLVNLGNSCKQLVMIGDHKQLKPKIDNYRLQKESRNGFDLNVSMFERLVIAPETGIPVIPLTVQHRMRPEISRIIRGMALYNELEDHKSTEGRNHVAGVANDVVFIDHRHPEKLDEETAAVGMETKVNIYEVDMVVSIAKYIIQQGQYSADQVTILTPYLGQLSLIRKKLEESKIGSLVSDQDFSELVRHDLNEGSGGQGDKKIRIATVDNFQGEESDVVIVSLVRSNPTDGRIGFLSSEERINVLFSRARDGMYIVGNLQSLAECASRPGRELWSNLKLVLDRHNHCLDYFPAECQKHKTLHKIQTPEDFVRMAPEGGCALRCNMMLECNHQCPKKCHGHANHVHSLVKCKEKVEDVCSNGHMQLRECHTTVKCTKTMKWLCPRGHSVLGICQKGRPDTCKTCKILEKYEEDAQRKEEQQEMAMLKQEQRLVASKSKLSSKMKVQESSSKQKMLEIECMLVDKELLTATAQLHTVNSDSCSNDNEVDNCANDSYADRNNCMEERINITMESEGTSFYDIEVKVPKEAQLDQPKIQHHPDRKCGGSNHGGAAMNECMNQSNDVTVESEESSICDAQAISNISQLEQPKIQQQHGEKGDGCNHSGGSYISSCNSGRLKISNIQCSEADENLKTKQHNKKTNAPGSSVVTQVPLISSSLLQNADFCDSINRFEASNFLEADDLIDNCLNKNQTKANKKTLEAFRYIIHDSLDPSEEKWWGVDAGKMKPLKSLEEAIQCWASFISLASTNEFPSITKKIAELFLAYECSIVDKKGALEIGRKRAVFVIEQARKHLLTHTSSQRSQKEMENELIQKDWKVICEQDPKAPAVVNDEIMIMTGLTEIKQALIDQYDLIRVSQRQGDAAASSYNVRFEGNPGTGKTTIARHYSTFLQQLTVLPEGSILFDVTAASLINKGVSHLEEMLEKIKKAGGGVIFVDEAYQLAGDKAGEKVLDFILPLSDALDGAFGKLVWIFAGYCKEMETLFNHNVGLPSRFPQLFTFVDYNASELQSIFHGLMEYKARPKESDPKKKQQKPPEKVSTRQLSNARRQTSYESPNGEIYDDRFGNMWTNDSYKGLWLDEHGNSTGYHPCDIGSTVNPLASTDMQIWEHKGKSWISNNGDKQAHYPGSTEPDAKSTSKKVLRKPPFTCQDERYIRIAMRRLERQSNRPGFGNARTVRTFFDSVRERQARRIAKETKRGRKTNDYLFTKEDLLGITSMKSQLKKSDAYLKLHEMQGLKPVKEQIDLLIKLGASNREREEAEKPLLEVMLNRVFLGNPGTGKTTVAKIYGQLLTEMGLLSKGEVIVKNPSDFRGSVLGSSEKNTRDILRAADGNVLVIDEAYALCTSNSLSGTSDPYGTAVIDTMVEQIQARPGDDRAVVMLGYRKEMEQMFKNVNPGLSRRFQLEQAYEFPDYDDASLLKILRTKARDSNLSIPVPVAKHAVRSLARARAKPNFGNGGAIDSILSQAKERMQKRDGTSDKMVMEDFAVEDIGLDEGALASLFTEMIGMDSIINKLEDLKCIVKFAKDRGENPANSISFNYLFLGNPGTGKTTIARLMGKMFKILGLLPDDEVFECTPKDFATGFAGQAGTKTMEMLELSRGGVLFIDEAYQLNPNRGGPYMTEVVDELCAKLTDDKFKGKLLVLLAGYDADMDEMLKVNPGLKSRFAERIAFDDLSEEATRDLIKLKLTQKKIPLTHQDSKSDELLVLARQLVNSKDFANGRDVNTVCDRTYAELAKRSSHRSTPVSLGDLRKAVDSLVLSRKPHISSKSCVNEDLSNQSCITSSPVPPATTIILEEDMQIEEAKEDQEKEEMLVEDPIAEENTFGSLPKEQIATLQEIVEDIGLNDEAGIEMLLSSNQHDRELIDQLIGRLGISEGTAETFLQDWRKAHKEAKRKKLKAKTKFQGMEAIWHCAVCGRGGLPHPVCFVAPYISGYQPIPI